jgi:hypothetical protein
VLCNIEKNSWQYYRNIKYIFSVLHDNVFDVNILVKHTLMFTEG